MVWSGHKYKRLLPLCLLTLLWFLSLSRFRRVEVPKQRENIQHSFEPTLTTLNEEDLQSVQFIPQATVDVLRRRDFFVAVGFLSPDNNERRRRRYLLRLTSFQYPGVATKSNNFSGELMIAFILARHPDHNYTFSAKLKEEAWHWNDIISLPMDEGKVSTNKTTGDGTHWGPATEIGMSRKVFHWYDFALRFFRNVTYISKADDDAFLHVPQFLADLHTLPRRRVYWGYMKPMTVKDPFYFAAGILYTLSRDVSEAFVAYEPLRKIIRVPYSKEREMEFKPLILENEDIMVARVISYLRLDNLRYYVESCCRFNDLNYGFCSGVRDTSVIIHGVKEGQYADIVNRLGKHRTVANPFYRGYLGWHASCT
ncbi:UDP-Gal or UDP-GlcNAc-dependent glycosyltransferase, putative [Trypanosoma equiperdum]|uniref:Hexosyltransferase n=3 Tax=Trypanozoon TaxID=39700 RepID=Q57U24_TRYB2|nr:UDP-Gal or UDP-GlcNAc-dependent glycosyltransferase, putative [Trypanosoma brucei brucei TREU927]AAX70894.1 UDP-Gal or UDP-GlcNAc-dependent glycosyltransferase, putative [Trypanosoma brucei]AAZ12095.1 UDP-Gal or UDP-GlcNAc-dependent glycosyltransferase, putative [Trypanosoma brucei brucei TREU927]RHW71574.1 UDP-Gal or UDP-GlcNAc-dependent glycosyltransferase [Trypanosoma brucei equiperdum]SCU66754.1 UDP-Gal or UDP-GlcNAc-dependent glycosyltransferase, putative [Trypanosoma equiperdum]